MIHLRIVAPPDVADAAEAQLVQSPAVTDVIRVPGASHKPAGDLILCDVAREEASIILGELRNLGIERQGSISIEEVATVISDGARRAEEAAVDLPFGDQVVWEEVESRTSEETTLSINFVEFMMIAALFAAVGIMLDSPILIVGAMVVGPEFGPLAAVCVALVERRPELARRSILALVVGFPAAIAAAVVASLILRGIGIAPEVLGPHPNTVFISKPDLFSFLIAYLAGTAGVLSLTSAKSGALIGVLISVTTIPAAANIGVAAAYGNMSELSGSALQLVVNLAAIVLGGVARLYVHRRVWFVRQRMHERRKRHGWKR